MMIDGELVDLRTLPVWERPALVFDRFDRLPVGGSFTVVTDNEPRGLATSLGKSRRQLMFEPQRIGYDEWIIQIVRGPADLDAPASALALRRTPAFHGFGAELFDRLSDIATVHDVRRGHTVIPEQQHWPYLGIAVDGVLAFGSAKHARTRIFGAIFPFELFGELEIFDGAPAASRVFALSKQARYLRIPREQIMELGSAHPELLHALGRVCAQRSRDLMGLLATQATMPIIARIARALLPFAAPERGLAPALAPLPNMTQSQIAAAAGTVKEVAARAIAELEERELLRRERGHITYLDRQKLFDLIKGSE